MYFSRSQSGSAAVGSESCTLRNPYSYTSFGYPIHRVLAKDGTIGQGPKAHTIPASGNAPGHTAPRNRGLKARPISSYLRQATQDSPRRVHHISLSGGLRRQGFAVGVVDVHVRIATIPSIRKPHLSHHTLPLHAITLPKRRIKKSGPHAALGEEST